MTAAAGRTPHATMRAAVIEQAASHEQTDPELDALRVAVAFEDVAEVVLDDDLLDPSVMRDPAVVARLLDDFIGGR